MKIELASALQQQKKFGEAESVFRGLIAADPKNADALNSLGYMLAERGEKLDEAVGFVERALAIDPGQSGVPRQPRMGLLQAGQPRRGREAAARGERQAALGVRHPGSSRRSARAARRLRRGGRVVAARARRRPGFDWPVGPRRQDQERPPEARQEQVAPADVAHLDSGPRDNGPGGRALRRLQSGTAPAADRSRRADARLPGGVDGRHRALPRHSRVQCRARPVRARSGASDPRDTRSPASHRVR